MGFSNFWINLVMTCISSVSFFVLLNGKPGTPFSPSRGLRQGDPLSLYLFLLICEALSLNLRKLVNDGVIEGIKLGRGVRLYLIYFLLMTRYFSSGWRDQICWRLIQNPNNLWAQVLKERYFQGVDFWKAKKGHRASWVWASLIAGRDEVLNHARVQILSGENTNIWTAKWLPTPHCGVIHPTSSVTANLPQLVADIMDKDSRQWNFQNVCMVLDRETMDAIRSIPIGNVCIPDRIVWPWSANGQYSVNSGYHKIHAICSDFSGGSAHSSHIINPAVWKELWNLAYQPKIKLFLWRLLSCSLATCLNLFRRKIRVSPLCPICEELEESKEHLFFLCPWVRTV
ncbi:hypothetical protein GBA52_020362 [Prunus armeniaca]|nr:hypothetical protein GBA52_020362 [Prunus armeniaca]